MNKLTLDFETYFDADITLKKLNYTEYAAKTHVMCCSISLNDDEPIYLINDSIKPTLNAIDWSSAELICHNAMFDALILKQHYGIEAARYSDTLAASRLLHHTWKHDLASLATALGLDGESKQHTALTSVKGMTWDALTVPQQQTLVDYNLNDVRLTRAIYDVLWPQVPQIERDIIDHTIKLFLRPTLVLDSTMAQLALDEERLETERLITESGLSKTDIRSDAKFSAHLSSLGYEIPVKWSAKKNCNVPAFAKSDPSDFYDENPEIQPLLDLKRRINSNIKESRTERLLSSCAVHNDKIPVAYNYCGAFTGRFSGSNNLNLQNLPRGSILRSCITAPPGQTLVVCDLSQVEARLTAWFCKEEKLLTSFRERRDIYCDVASEIFNKPINKKDHPHERFCGKSAVLGLGYGMGAERFQAWCKQSGATLELDFCQNIVKKYREKFSEISSTWKALNLNIFKLKTAQKISAFSSSIAYTEPSWLGVKKLPIIMTPNKIHLPSGRVLNYGNVITGEHGGLRIENGRYIHGAMLLENIIQALSRDILVEQILIAEQHYPVVMHTHDEIVWSVPSNEAPAAKEKLLSIMRTPPDWCKDIPLDAEAGTGQRFNEAK